MDQRYLTELLSNVNRLEEKYRETGDTNLQTQAINLLQDVSQSITFKQFDLDVRTNVLTRLGFALLRRYLHTEIVNDLASSFFMFSKATHQFPEEDSKGIELGNDIATFIRLNGPGNDREDVIRATINFYEDLIQRCSGDTDLLFTLMGNKANGLRNLHEITSLPSDIQDALENHEKLLSRVPSSSPLRPGFLSNYGNALRQNYMSGGPSDALAKAIEIQRLAISCSLDQEHEDLYEFTLSLSYIEQYKLTNDIVSLNLAIEAIEHSLKNTSLKSLDFLKRSTIYGSFIKKLYGHTNRLTDLDRAISVLVTAQEEAQGNRAIALEILPELSEAYDSRYDLIGKIHDLEMALQTQAKLISLLTKSSPSLPHHLMYRSILQAKIYEISQEITLLYQAKEGLQQAIQLEQSNQAFIARCYHNLSNTNKIIFGVTGSQSDLYDAIHNRELSIKKTPVESSELPARIAGLGQDKLDLFIITQDSIILDQAIDKLREASNQISKNAHDAPGIWYITAHALAIRHSLTPSDLYYQEVVKYFTKALQSSTTTPEKLMIGTSWGQWALNLGAWSEAAQAFRPALIAADEIIQIQSSLRHSTDLIANVKDLHVNASYALAKNGEYSDSVIALEHSRARLLSQKISLSSNELQMLSNIDDSIFKAATEAASRLNVIFSQQLGVINNPIAISPSGDAYDAFENWNLVLSQIRKIPGFENFALMPTLDEIWKLALNRPIIYIATTHLGGFALIISSSGTIHYIPIKRLSLERIHNLFRRTSLMAVRDGNPLAAIDTICEWLWPNVMGPLIKFLETINVTEVFLVPIGILGILPLHAAWKLDISAISGRQYALDRLTISYIPSARLMLNVSQALNIPIKSITVIEDPTSSLPFAPEESTYILNHFLDANLLGGEAATKSAVLKNLEGRNILHFSCHAYSIPTEPMNSALILAKGESLTVGDIHVNNFHNTRLVVLSACETGLIGRDVMDEVISFPSAWMSLGVPCIISAIWSVNDESTSRLMMYFYENLVGRGMRPDQALRQSQIAVRDQSLSRFSHPYYWGAFFATGS